MRKPAKRSWKLFIGWDKLHKILERGNPKRFFAGKFSSENTKIIQTARNSPRRRQKVKSRQRVVMARKKRVARAVASTLKLLAFCTALAILTRDVIGYLHSSSRFSITHVGVKGNTHVTARTVIDKSGIVEGENIFRVKLADIAAAVERIPWVHSARVCRKLPDEVHIEVTERKPLALVLSNQLLYVDEDGRILAKFDCSEETNTPIITGKALAGLKVGDNVKVKGIAESFEIMKIMKKLDMSKTIPISEINIDDPLNIVMISKESGANIVLGSGDLQGKLWRLAKIAEAINRNERLHITDLRRVDMRFEDVVPAKFKKG